MSGLVAQSFVSATAREGEGGIALLRRYDIYNNCNLNKFFQLNGLNSKSGLASNKSYLLPIQIMQYDGKSIRSTLDISDIDLALLVQDYNDRMQTNGLKPGDFRKDKALWVPWHIRNCGQETPAASPAATPTKVANRTEPVAAGTRVGPFPIFGETYQSVPLYDRKLEGCVFYILSGHGGPDPGAEGVWNGHTLHEDEYAYDIALRLARNLISHGATTYILVRDPDDGIRDEEFLEHDTDELCWVDKRIPRDQKLRLTQRTDVVNALYLEHKKKGCTYQRCLDLHLDSEPSSLNMDMAFFYKYRSAAGKSFAMNMNDAVDEMYQKYQPGRDYRGFLQARDLHVVRECLPPTLLIELGNLHSSRDRKRFTIVENRKYLAEWLCYALMQDELLSR